MTATERVQELRAAVTTAQERVAELDDARREGALRVERARGELMEHYRAQGRGDPGEDREEARLVGALRAAESGLTAKPVQLPHGGGLADVVLQAVDEAAEARYEGAVERLEECQRDLRDYVRGHLAELAVERAPEAAAIRDRTAAALSEARAAASAYERMRSDWARLLTLADQQGLVAEVPENPLACLADAGEPVMPMPVSFTP